MLWNMIILAFREIKRNVLRSVLTTIGIVIGVAAVITMVTIGGGATKQIKQMIEGLGSNLLIVSPGKRMGPGQSTDVIPFTLSDVQAISRDINAVAAICPVSTISLKAIFSNQNWTTQITGTDNQYFKVTNRTIKQGRFFNESELRIGSSVCIIGETLRKKLFGGQPALGEYIRLQKLTCQIIGILDEKGQNSMGMDRDDMVVIPIATYQRRISGNQYISLIQISVQNGVPTEKVQRDITHLMRERRHLSENDEDNFTVTDMKEIVKMLTKTTKMLTGLLSAVAAVSLLVGGIGIMNIMLVSVTERTREIGIRLAIGAYEFEVLMQFLVEAVAISSLGGVIGIVLAIGASIFLSDLLLVPFIFNAEIIVIAFLFSAAVGVIFGYFPALKAARMDPIEALRHE